MGSTKSKMADRNRLLILLLTLALLQGCSTLAPIGDSPSTQVEPLARVESSAPTSSTSSGDLSSPQDPGSSDSNGMNRYEAQKQQRMSGVPAAVTAQYQDALALMRAQQWQQADAQLAQLSNDYPQLSGPYVNRAIIALNGNQLEQASTLLAHASRVNPDNPYAHQLAGVVATEQGKFVAAEGHYRQALAIWPTYPEANINLAILLELYRGRLQDAHPYYAAYLATAPQSQQAQRLLAALELKIKRAGLEVPNSKGQMAVNDDPSEGL